MTARTLCLALALLAASPAAAFAQTRSDVVAAPALRANVTVSGDLVRIGDVIDNAGTSGGIAIYRAPDLGTIGTLPVDRVLTSLRAHHVIGVDTKNLREITITRLARTIEGKELELAVARALERKNGLGEAANLSLTFDREAGDVRLEASNSGALQPTSVRYDSRSNRFDVTLDIANESGAAAAKLRFTGTAIETVETAVLARGIERNEVIKASDVTIERRPRAEVGSDAAPRDRAIGMQARKQLRAGQAVKLADLSKPDLVQKDQAVTLIYQASGLYLTIRGKALEAGTEGDVVNVLNLQSKRTISGVVTGRAQVSIQAAPPRQPELSDAASSVPAPVAVAAAQAPSPASSKSE